MDVALLRDLLRLSAEDLGRALGLGESAAHIVHRWEGGEPVLGSEAMALTYLAQGAFAERSGLPEFLVCGDGGGVAGTPTFVFRTWRPRFIAITADAETPPLPGQGWTWVDPQALRLVVLQWWDDPAGFDTTDLIYRAAAKIRKARGGLALGDRQSWLRLLQATPSFAAVLTGERQVFDFVNESYVAMMGQRDFLDAPVREVAPEVAGQGYFEMLHSVFETGRRVIVNSRPLLLNRGDGVLDEHIVDLVYEPMRDVAGDVAGIFVEGIDLTARRQASAALAEPSGDPA